MPQTDQIVSIEPTSGPVRLIDRFKRIPVGFHELNIAHLSNPVVL